MITLIKRTSSENNGEVFNICHFFFWNRWRSEYLPTLQKRTKWKNDRENLEPGNIVLMKDSAVYRNEWPIGVVTETYTSTDNRVRKVVVRLSNDRKVLTTPVNELVLLAR